jgi:hypothetical protein
VKQNEELPSSERRARGSSGGHDPTHASKNVKMRCTEHLHTPACLYIVRTCELNVPSVSAGHGLQQ